MRPDFTFLYFSLHYPYFQHVLSFLLKDNTVEVDVANFLQKTEQQVSNKTLDNVYAFASAVVK